MTHENQYNEMMDRIQLWRDALNLWESLVIEKGSKEIDTDFTDSVIDKLYAMCEGDSIDAHIAFSHTDSDRKMELTIKLSKSN